MACTRGVGAARHLEAQQLYMQHLANSGRPQTIKERGSGNVVTEITPAPRRGRGSHELIQSSPLMKLLGIVCSAELMPVALSHEETMEQASSGSSLFWLFILLVTLNLVQCCCIICACTWWLSVSQHKDAAMQSPPTDDGEPRLTGDGIFMTKAGQSLSDARVHADGNCHAIRGRATTRKKFCQVCSQHLQKSQQKAKGD